MARIDRVWEREASTGARTVEVAVRGRRPRVSIGIPVYNGERFIRETLESVLAQTFEDFEVLVVDNASTDGTAEICRDYAARDSRIRYVRNDVNIGMVRNYGRTVALSSGEYFKLANADDLSAPALVEKCVEVLDRQPEVVLCYARTTLIDEHGRTIRRYEDGLDLRQPRVEDRFLAAVEGTKLVNVLQGTIRLEALRRTGLLGRYVGSDVVLVAELALYGQFHELPDWLFFRRIHAGAFSSQPTMDGSVAVVDPALRGSRMFRRWRHQLEYQRAVLRAPLSVAQKVRLVARLLRIGVSERYLLIAELAEGLRPRRRPS